MIDFASSLYLGMRHEHRLLPSWDALTSGVPSVLELPHERARSSYLARSLARLLGLSDGLLGVSTLHLAWDFFGMIDPNRDAIFIDSESYPIMQWGAERAKCRGVTVKSFRHHDTGSLYRALATIRRGRRPVVVADGFCPGCGVAAPVAEYYDAIRSYGGTLLLDDTQALGVLGYAPTPSQPLGHEGGGTLRWCGASSDINIDGHAIVIASLAKGFGTPLAMLSGSSRLVRRFARSSNTRIHCSPPSRAAVAAGLAAVHINATRGEQLRTRLFQSIEFLRDSLSAFGLTTQHNRFPIQSLAAIRGEKAETLYKYLAGRGIRSVLHQMHRGEMLRISLVITARHHHEEIERGVREIGRGLAAIAAKSTVAMI